MKISRISLLFTLLLLSSLLTACSGSGQTLTSSWPGVLVDPEQSVVYVADQARVYALDPVNGTEKWRFEKDAGKSFFFAAPALSQDNQLIVAGYDNVLYSLNSASGQENWSFTKATNRYVAAPLVEGERIFAPSADYVLYTLDLKGNLLWSFKTEQALWATPAVNGDLVYVPSMDRHVYALNLEDGSLSWKSDDLNGAVVSRPILQDDLLYVGTFNAEMVALKVDTGKVAWRAKMNGWVWSEPLLQDGTLYVGDLSGTLSALDASTGSIKWKYQPETGANNIISGAPVIVGDTLFFVSENGNLYAVDVISGGQKWSKPFEGKLYSGPFVSGDTLLFTTSGAKGVLVAVDVNGNQKWVFVPAK